MSLFGAMNTAISGLGAQSASFSNISDNVANSQTTGFKRVDTSFKDYLTTSSPTINDSEAVVAKPNYVNNVQGTISQSDNPLSMAIAGQGFFAVSQATGEVDNAPTFDPQQYYTRAGDFQMNANGYLVNSSGQYLNGWLVDSSSGDVNQNTLQPIQVSQTVFNPVATTDVTLSANLPATPANPPLPLTSTENYTASDGSTGTMNLSWVRSSLASDTWTVSMTNASTGTWLGSADMTFQSETSGSPPVPSGNLLNLNPASLPSPPNETSATVATDGNNDLTLTDANNLTYTFSNFSLGAALPSGSVPNPQIAAGQTTPATPISSQIDLYDALGNQQPITLQWEQSRYANGSVEPNTWTVSIFAAGTTSPLGVADVQFGKDPSGNALPAGTIGTITSESGVQVSNFASGTAATLTFSHDFGSGSQTIALNLGNYGGTSGLTQYAGTTYTLHSLTQNGVPPGAFSSVSTQANGDVVVNYDNGQTRTIAQVPVVTFDAPNELQSQNGQAFTATLTSGTPLASAAGTNGAGDLVTSSLEGSNVDIASEFSQLIVAQSAYSANTKVVTTANQMLQQTINMQT